MNTTKSEKELNFLSENEIIDLLQSLADKSLLKKGKDDDYLNFSLPESIKEYTNQKLEEANEHLLTKKKHIFYYKIQSGIFKKLLLSDDPNKIKHAMKTIDGSNSIETLQYCKELNKGRIGLHICKDIYYYWFVVDKLLEGLIWQSYFVNECKEYLKNNETEIFIDLAELLSCEARFEEAREILLKTIDQAKKLSQDSVQAKACLALGHQYSLIHDLIKAKELVDQALELAQKCDDNNIKAKCLAVVGSIYADLGKTNEARETINGAMSNIQFIEYRNRNNFLDLCFTGFIRINDYVKAEEIARISLEISKEINEKIGEEVALRNLASATIYQGKYQESESFCLQYLKLTQGHGSNMSLCMIYNFLGYIENKKSNYQNALNNYKQMVLYSVKTKNKYLILETLKEVSTLLIENNRLVSFIKLAAGLNNIIDDDKVLSKYKQLKVEQEKIDKTVEMLEKETSKELKIEYLNMTFDQMAEFCLSIKPEDD